MQAQSTHIKYGHNPITTLESPMRPMTVPEQACNLVKQSSNDHGVPTLHPKAASIRKDRGTEIIRVSIRDAPPDKQRREETNKASQKMSNILLLLTTNANACMSANSSSYSLLMVCF
jgi:hypothetical protein